MPWFMLRHGHMSAHTVIRASSVPQNSSNITTSTQENAHMRVSFVNGLLRTTQTGLNTQGEGTKLILVVVELAHLGWLYKVRKNNIKG
jgi:hypothetical protein